jgi:hypothetical protein
VSRCEQPDHEIVIFCPNRWRYLRIVRTIPKDEFQRELHDVRVSALIRVPKFAAPSTACGAPNGGVFQEIEHLRA